MQQQHQRGFAPPPSRYPPAQYYSREHQRGLPPPVPSSSSSSSSSSALGFRDRDSSSLVTEVVPVPSELMDWVSGSKVQAMFLKVKEASGIAFITSTVDANGANITIHSPSETAAKVARMLVEINFKEQIKYQKDMQRLHVMQENLFEVQGAVASGQRIEFTVPRDLVGIIIGKKGTRIQDVQRETGVTDIHIDGETGKITISGPSPSSVQKARELVDIVEEKVPLPAGRGELLSRDFSSLNDIRDMSKCIIARVPRNEDCIVLIGTRPSITSAKLILETQMEYMMKRAQLYESEQSIRQQLTSLKGSNRDHSNGGMTRHYTNNNNTNSANNNSNNNNNNSNTNNGKRRGGNEQQNNTQEKRETGRPAAPAAAAAAPPPPPPSSQTARQAPQNNLQRGGDNERKKTANPSASSAASAMALASAGTKGFSTAELQKKLSALAMGETASNEKNLPNAAPAPNPNPAPSKGTSTQNENNNNNKKQSKSNNNNNNNQSASTTTTTVEDGVHTSRRSRNANQTTAPSPLLAPPTTAETNPPKTTRGTVSNKVTKPNGRGETLRDAVEAKKS